MAKGIVSNRGGLQIAAGGANVVQGEVTGQTGTTITFVANYTFGAAGVLFYRNGVLMDKVASFTATGTDNAEEYQEINNGSASTQITLNSTNPAVAGELFQMVFMEGTTTVATGGGSGVGDADTLFVDNADDSDLADFTTNGVVISASDPVNGTDSFLMTHDAVLERSIEKTFNVPPKFRGKNLTIELDVNSDANEGNLVLDIDDVTNTASLLTAEQLTLVDSLVSSRKSRFTFDCPASCAEMTYKVRGLPQSGVFSRIDDITLKITKRETREVLETEQEENVFSARIENNGTATLVSQSLPFIDSVLRTGTGNVLITFTPGFFTETPAVSLAGDVLSGDGVIYYELESASSIRVRTADNGSPTDLHFNITVQRQGADFKDLSLKSVMEKSTFNEILINENDSMIRALGFDAFGSTDTKIIKLLSVESSTGSAITRTSTAANGDVYTVNEAGVYSVSLSANMGAANRTVGVTLNTSGLTTDIYALPMTEVLVQTVTDGVDQTSPGSWAGYLNEGDQLRIHSDSGAAPVSDPNRFQFTISKVGTPKILQTAAESKVKIPTTFVRYQDSTGLASGAEASTVQFVNLTDFHGEGFVVDNSNGTVLTVKKDGILSIGTTATVSGTVTISRNASNPASFPPATEVVAALSPGASVPRKNISWEGQVKEGDVFRVAVNSGSGGDDYQYFNALHLDTEIQVAVSNVAPQFSEDDSAIRVHTGNGAGTTNTNIRRFASIEQSLGSAITYLDSAADGGSFVINEDGVYHINYFDLDQITTVTSLGLSLNSTQLSTALDAINVSDRLAMTSLSRGTAGTESAHVSWSGPLKAGDIVRAHFGSGPMEPLTSQCGFTIAKEGRTLAEVDVTPFVSIQDEKYYSVSQMENVFSARIQNNGAASIISESSEFIESVSRDATGTVTIYFKDSFFTELPSVQVIVDESPNPNTTINPVVSSRNLNSITVRTYNIVGAVFADYPFDIIVHRQGADKKDLQKALVQLNDFPRVNNTLQQLVSHVANLSTLLDASGDLRFNTSNINNNGDFLIIVEDDPSNSRTKFVAARECMVDCSFSYRITSGGSNGQIRVNNVPVHRTNLAYSTNARVVASGPVRLLKGDYITFDSGVAVSGVVDEPVEATILATAMELERVTNLDRQENIFSALVDGSAGTGVTITSQSSPFIDSVVRTATGVFTVNFTPGFFTEIPTVIGTVADSNSFNLSITTISTSSCNLNIRNTNSDVDSDRDFSLMVQRQGEDYKALHDIVAVVPEEKIAYIDVHATKYTDNYAATTAYKNIPLDHVTGDTEIVSISSNQATFGAGVYDLEFTGLGAHNGSGILDFLIYNFTDSVNHEEFLDVAYSNANAVSHNNVIARIELTEEKTFEFRTKSSIAAGLEFFGRIKVRKIR